MQVFYLVLF